MATTRDWQRNREMWIRVLERQTGTGLEVWSELIRKRSFADARDLRAWLSKQQVTGYAQSLLVVEQFGYPDFVAATAEQLSDAQYAGSPDLRRIYDAIIDAATRCGELVIQARKTDLSLVSARRTFARVQPTSKSRVILGLRLDSRRPRGRLRPSTIHETMRLQMALTAPGDVDAEVQDWLRQAYEENS
jgi:Domain of unknown function (DUF5655)